jgi:phosphatidylserine/phosphatidylglycerophosphate/cardiolipin synthase-like enzyme
MPGAAAGRPLEDDTTSAEAPTALHHPAEDEGADVAAMRVVATVPNTAGMFRVDQLVAALARKTLWLTDAYYAGTTPYVQALRSAAADGVDVRLLVPGMQRTGGAALSIESRLSATSRSRDPRVRVERINAARQDRRRRWQMGKGSDRRT